MGVAAKRPSIIIDRGNFSWTNTTRREAMPNRTGGYATESIGATRQNNYNITDLWAGSITFLCMSDNAFVADELGNILFYILLAYKERFKPKGIQNLEGPRMGQEGMRRLQSQGPEIVTVPVTVSFQKSETLTLADKLFNCRLYDQNDHEYYENIDYKITTEGTQIYLLFEPEDGLTFSVDYIDAITLEEVNNADLISTSGNNRLYTVPDNGKIYGYYKILSSVKYFKDDSK